MYISFITHQRGFRILNFVSKVPSAEVPSARIDAKTASPSAAKMRREAKLTHKLHTAADALFFSTTRHNYQPTTRRLNTINKHEITNRRSRPSAGKLMPGIRRPISQFAPNYFHNNPFFHTIEETTPQQTIGSNRH